MGSVIGRQSPLGQSFFIPKPTLTEKNLPDLTGKVCIVTGGNAGVGFEVCRILYGRNATVYLAGRSEDKCRKAISSIVEPLATKPTGSLKFLKLDLADLSSIKSSADEFLGQEKRLDWLCNNAGVMLAPAGSKGTQNHELHMVTNCLGPWLFTRLLHPILSSTAGTSAPNTVRVSWAGSVVIDLYSPKKGIPLNSNGVPDLPLSNPQTLYAISKAGNLFYASEYGKLCTEQNARVVSTCFNPGNLKTELQRYVGPVRSFFQNFMLHPAILGAYTELYSGFSPDVTTENNGCYIAPWGRIGRVRPDVQQSCKGAEEGGNGIAKAFWDWSEKECKPYM
ncbi:short-chain alcohol dehydrogenase [Cladophialophora chaetospira]|uniref:Short-chain alcohol dehydrogenase n=1 Tax=Cladophialophora chaetospira TaxID=386627 RepID=A0AA38XIT0_9EURO|nr:short-chain alcohol dehydrogenase [Cladophialophora chaetospira]